MTNLAANPESKSNQPFVNPRRAALELVEYMATPSPDVAHIRALEQKVLDAAVREARACEDPEGWVNRFGEVLTKRAFARQNREMGELREKLRLTEAVLEEARKDSARLEAVLDNIRSEERDGGNLSGLTLRLASAGLALVLLVVGAVGLAGCGGSSPSEDDAAACGVSAAWADCGKACDVEVVAETLPECHAWALAKDSADQAKGQKCVDECLAAAGGAS
jgi:hypothetical protein